MARYNVRDLLGHFVKIPPRRNEEGMCPHACCKGKRPHPSRFPVLLDRSTLRSMSDRELEAHFERSDVGNNGRAVTQVTRELERRETAREAKASRAAARASDDEEYRLYLEGQWTLAEEATRGNLVNKKGEARGIDGRSLWTASNATRQRYASEELRDYWNRHGILTRREFGRAHNSAASQVRANRARRESRLYGVY